MISIAIPKLPFIEKQQTIDFYVNQLGFSLISDYGEYFIIKKDNAELHFFHHPQLKPAASHFMIYLRIDKGIDEFYQNLLSKKVSMITPLETKPWGQKEFALTDTNSTLLTFGESN
ncbi:Glyoxalase/bleomycin resistance protein/dioxygenase [Emticicia oligotrophica DSM 17448]|uniref:Bleomycin resistance protein n=1 Tax=Emticicia oligotrophica (strain DSM 17448 / CIP 109782 / MTCC 6937 / GPTSA100-15) TaxID=929562 RepID=A0ABN4ANJ0_EMTOG|nr:VOC family protein [Emticicia oligotrophica]AFK03874.1 Glyoxalase/bleomycin resistance protein/dioxygenase [Emticicia oligotrophica DSM 17448]